MADNALTRLPVAGQLGVAIGAGMAIGAGFYFFLYQAKLEERTARQGELNRLRETIRALEITVAKLPEFEREVRALEEKLEVLKRFLPAEKETAALMKQVHSLAMNSTLTIAKFNFKSPVSRDFYQEHPVDVEVNGSYHNLALFFDKIGRLPRLVNASDIKIKAIAVQRLSNTINAQFVAMTYTYQETPPGGAAGAKPGARPGARPGGR
jgi:type IV pilus assembly protein PilO